MADDRRTKLLLRKRELLLKKAKGEVKQPNVLERIGMFAKKQFPEIVEEATGKAPGFVPTEISEIGAKIKEKAPRFVKRGLEAAAETVRGGVVPSFVPGGRTTLEKPGIAARTAGAVIPALRVPEAVGVATRLGVQQIIPPEETPIPGFVAEVVGGLSAAGIRGLFRTARLGNKQQVLTKVRGALDEANNAQRTLGKNITAVFDSPLGDKPVDINKVSETLKNIPSNVQNKILKEANIFKIEILPDASIKPTARNIWRLRQALDDFLTSKDFIEATKASKQVILSARRGVAKILSEVDPKIKTVIKNFSDFMDSFQPVRKVLTDARGNAVANKIINASKKKTAEPAVRIALEKFGKEFTKTQEALKGATGFLKGTLLKGALKKAGVVTGLGALGGGVARRFIGTPGTE